MTWLMVVDVQPAFGHESSPWYTPSLDAVADRIAGLLPVFGERVVFTRFVPPAEVSGSWQLYYDKWTFAHDAADWLWALDARFGVRESVSSHRFSKWSPEIAARVGDEVALCGVSTDCCVLATALAAVDDGVHVRLLRDGCAAKSDEIHERAVALMASRAPMLTVTTIAGERARHG